MNNIPIALTIAGSDCCSGAGIQADLKTFSTHQCHGLTALTCIVAENPATVKSIHPVPTNVLKDQIKILLDTYPVGAIKTGMLYSKEHLLTVANVLSNRHKNQLRIPLVIDPVMVATSGSSLVSEDAIKCYQETLLPLATLITPNMPEASVLLGKKIETKADLEPAAKELAESYQTSVLLKGGHLRENDDITDILWHNNKAHHFSNKKIDIPCTHGTGCTLSAAITAHLAIGTGMIPAVEKSIQWIHNAIKQSFQWKKNNQLVHCLNHLKK